LKCSNPLPSIPTLPFFRHPVGISGIKAGTPFGPVYFNRWVGRACDDLGVQRIGLYALVKHSTMTAFSTQLTPEQIRRGGSKHTSRAMERYLLPEIGETRLVQNTKKNAPGCGSYPYQPQPKRNQKRYSQKKPMNCNYG